MEILKILIEEQLLIKYYVIKHLKSKIWWLQWFIIFLIKKHNSNLAPFNLKQKKNFLNYEKVSKYYDHDQSLVSVDVCYSFTRNLVF